MNETTTQYSPSNAGENARADASGSRRRRYGRVAILVAAVAGPLVVWAIAVPIARIDLTAGTGPAAPTVTPSSIVVAGLVMGFGAWGVIAVLERFSTRSGRIFAIVGWTVLVLSLLGPVVTGATGVVLAVLLAMHLATGATLIIGLPLAARGAATVYGARLER
ncbi:DUF6069 family protein [Agromyces humatus]|nr:DUF6069 family protein [Agromyces humatus]